MTILNLLLLVFSFVFLILATLQVTNLPRVHWGWLGLALWVLTTFINGVVTIK
jgi:hypothetical protein